MVVVPRESRSGSTLSGRAPLSRPQAVSPKTGPTFSDSTSPLTVLVNAAFLQEIKDSNTTLWHAAQELRCQCELDTDAIESPQGTIKRLLNALDELRDAISLEFALEESYGFITVAAEPEVVLRGMTDPEKHCPESSRKAREQHRSLYLQLIGLVEEAEELQYRGCEQMCLVAFVDKIDRFSRDLTAHERFEADLIARQLA